MEKMTKKEMKAVVGGCIYTAVYCGWWSTTHKFEGHGMMEEMADCMGYHGC